MPLQHRGARVLNHVASAASRGAPSASAASRGPPSLAMVTMFEVSLWSRLLGICHPDLTVGWLELRCWEWLMAIRPWTRMVMSEPSGSDDEPECTDDEDDEET